MAAAEAIVALREHWDGVLALLGKDARSRLLVLVEQLASVGERDRADATLAVVTLLASELPADHPVRRAVAAREPRWDPGVTEAELGTVLADLDIRLTLQQVRDRLLAAPAYSAEELRALGGDPGEEGLIRLRAEDGTVRLPAFQFDPRGAPLPVVVAVNRLLDANSDPWGVADWWLGRNARLGDVPSRLLGLVPDGDLVNAAWALRWEG